MGQERESALARDLAEEAAARGAVNPAQVAHLLGKRLRFGPKGHLLDDSGQLVTAEEAVSRFLERQPHMVGGRIGSHRGHREGRERMAGPGAADSGDPALHRGVEVNG